MHIEVSAATLADQPVQVRVSGLAAHQLVTISAQATDADKQVWQSHGEFTADADGAVSLDTSAPTSGTYKGADGMGLIWSMQPRANKPQDQVFWASPPQSQPSFTIELTVAANGQRLAARTIEREWLAPGETAKTLTLGANKVSGELFLPPPGTPRHPAVLVFGGGEGGMRYTFTAALLAAHGYPALTVAYFAYPGLPQQLESIPLEYFVTAGRILAAAPGVDPAHLIVMGYSRGSEAALLLANYFPHLFHGAIVYSPSAVVNPSQLGPGQSSLLASAWTLDDTPVPQVTIPVGHLSGPFLAFAGANDGLWSSQSWANEISAELDAAKNPYPHHAFTYFSAGHAVGTYPYEPIGTTGLLTLGGTRADDLAGQRDSWAKVLALLASLSG